MASQTDVRREIDEFIGLLKLDGHLAPHPSDMTTEERQFYESVSFLCKAVTPGGSMKRIEALRLFYKTVVERNNRKKQ